MNEPKILFIAYACTPDKGSEGGIGWRWFEYVSRRYRTHLITADTGHSERIRQIVSESKIMSENASFTFYKDIAHPTTPIKRALWSVYQPYYYKLYRGWLDAAYK